MLFWKTLCCVCVRCKLVFQSNKSHSLPHSSRKSSLLLQFIWNAWLEFPQATDIARATLRIFIENVMENCVSGVCEAGTAEPKCVDVGRCWDAWVLVMYCAMYWWRKFAVLWMNFMFLFFFFPWLPFFSTRFSCVSHTKMREYETRSSRRRNKFDHMYGALSSRRKWIWDYFVHWLNVCCSLVRCVRSFKAWRQMFASRCKVENSGQIHTRQLKWILIYVKYIYMYIYFSCFWFFPFIFIFYSFRQHQLSRCKFSVCVDEVNYARLGWKSFKHLI